MRDDKLWARFPLTRAACQPPAEQYDLGEEDEEAPAPGNALLRLLADDPANGMHELSPGVYYQDKEIAEDD